MTCVYSIVPATSFTAWCKSVLVYQSLRHTEFPNRRGQSPSVILVSVSSPAVLAKAVESTIGPVDVGWVPLRDSQLPWKELQKRCGVPQELVFGIPVSVPTVFPEAQEIGPPACWWWLFPHRSVSGNSVTASTEVFVLDLVVADFRLAKRDLLRPRRA